LQQADVIVSTANHEFFGISVVEAIAAGAFPLVPNRLSYPEIIGLSGIEDIEHFFYDGSAGDLADKLSHLADRTNEEALLSAENNFASLADRFKWQNLAPQYDQALEEFCRKLPS